MSFVGFYVLLSSSSSLCFVFDAVFAILSKFFLISFSSVARPLVHALQRARAMLECRAYLHWYERYGTKEADFVAAFDEMDSVIESYQGLLL